ncbi:MAG TPA: type II secretion system protein J [Luteimonas sp.]|nr:type II secretion system protein J [Luteimonas sp.]
MNRVMPSCSGGSAAKATGFTLIEVLLATTLLAAGLALAFATLRAATVTVNRGELIAQRSERIRAVEGFLRTRITSARAIAFALDQDSGLAVRFIGESARMRFVADLPDYLGWGGPYLHDISVADSGNGQRLLVSFSMVQNGVELVEPSPRKPEPLVEDLSAVRFRYRGLDADGGLGGWQERWTAPDRLPLQVSVQISARDGGAWPELVITLPAAGSNGQMAPQPGQLLR